MVIILMLALTLTGIAFLNAGIMENGLVRREIAKTQAFYLAESGIERLSVKLYAGGHWSIKSQGLEGGGSDGSYRPAVQVTSLGEGRYWVEYYDGNPPYALPYAISIGQTIKDGQVIAEKKIKVKLPFLAEPYEHAIYADSRYSLDWELSLRGTGDPYRDGSYEYGGKDTIEGDIYTNAAIHLYEETSVYPPPNPNTYGLLGEVSSTEQIFKHPDPGFAGYVPYTNEYAEPIDIPDLRSMNYAQNNTHDVEQIFDDEGVFSGSLPFGHELRQVVVKNPSNRSSECSSTTGDDYFFEPQAGIVSGSPYTGETPLDLGVDRIYYVDGDVWFHHTSTYGFEMSGKTLIVATGDIHISDNIEYADSESMLALVALGKYNEITGDLVSGGNIYLGDPRYGTTYTVSSFMFAGNNFLYNVDSVNPNEYQRPQTGFNVFGNWAAINEVSIMRDWYEIGHWEQRWNWRTRTWEDVWLTDEWKPTYFDPNSGADGEWKDVEDDHLLIEEELERLRHYQMKVTYDERIYDPLTQPAGLPVGYGAGSIFTGYTDWEEIQ